jgi:C1A family cysteine protease
VDNTWYNAKQTQGNLDVYQADTKQGGHAVSIVGYTSKKFIIRNSWGISSWGDNGFGYASLDYAEAAFTEAYGVSV